MTDTFFHRIITSLKAKRIPPSSHSAPPSSTGVIDQPAAQQGEEHMDPTMGQTAGFGINTDQIDHGDNALVVTDSNSPPLAPATSYPIGIIDFNKPLLLIDLSDDDAEFTDVKVLAVLTGADYPVVVTARNSDGQEVIAQFDTDGDDRYSDFKIENVDPGPRTVYVRLLQEGRNILADEATMPRANDDFGYTDRKVIGVFPIVIPPAGTAVVASVEEEEHPESGSAEVQPVYAWVNGRRFRAGDSVTAYRNNFGTRTGTVIKTREHSYKSLFVKFEGSDPYWALNKNIRL